MTAGQTIYGIDFTSAPSRPKPITCVTARLAGEVLRLERLERWESFGPFERRLGEPGPWLAGFDFPFSFARAFLEGIGWPMGWPELSDHLAGMPKADYLAAHARFRAAQPVGKKHLPRALDRRTGGVPANNVVNPPVGRMLFEGIPRLRSAGVSLPGLAQGDPTRRAVEAYPAAAARALIGTASYKDGPWDTWRARRELRREILNRLCGPNPYRLRIALAPGLADLTADPKGDDLDAALCAVQAAWAECAGIAKGDGPPGADPVEGWIADPAALPEMRASAPTETTP